MQNRKTVILTVSLISATMLFAVATFKTQAQDKTQQMQEKDLFPVVDYANQESVDEKRKKKSEKYNKSALSFPTNIFQDSETGSYEHWSEGLTALPVEKSEVVVLGKVVSAKAYLSNDKGSVYSEFKIEIETIFKNSSQQELEDDKYLRAERLGGIVRYPTGYKFWFHVLGQEMPGIDRRYVFFLTNNFEYRGRHKQDLHLLTAYELKDGKVFPLDNPGTFHPIATTYKGKEESVLLNDLQKALKP